MHTHEIPTHLHGADPVVAGCTWSQLFTLGSGAAGAFWGWHTLLLPPIAHTGMCAVPLLVAAACAFWRPDGHCLLTWLGLVAAYAVTPRRLVWQREVANLVLVPRPAVPALAGTGWVDDARPCKAAIRCLRGAAHGPALLLPPAIDWRRAHRVSACGVRRGGADRVVPAVVPARRRGGLLTILLGRRVLCLSTHHLRVAGQGGDA